MEGVEDAAVFDVTRVIEGFRGRKEKLEKMAIFEKSVRFVC